MKLGIIGVGVVGRTLRDWFVANTTHKLSLFDPGQNHLDELAGSEYVFICVPVPTNISGAQDISMLHEAIVRSKAQAPEATIFIRSTVLPGTCDMYKNVFAMPEFLTERYAIRDMEQLNIIVGGKSKIGIPSNLFLGKRVQQYTNNEAEMIKYAHNCFAAVKVNFFNQIADLCERQHRTMKYVNVLEGMNVSRLFELEQHTQVPGHDGKRGFGGKCLPKDLYAFATAYSINSLLEVCKENDKIRG